MEISLGPGWYFVPAIALALITVALIAIPSALKPSPDGHDPKAARLLLRLTAFLTGVLSLAAFALAVLMAVASGAD